MIATANLDFLALVQEDDQLQQALIESDLVLADGMPLIWMSKLLGDPLPERVAGSDMVPRMLGLAEAKGYRIFFLGGKEEVIHAAEQNIRKKWPELQIAGMYSPPFAPLEQMDHASICQRIKESQTDLLFVSFGCPKQEKWMAMNFRELGVPVSIGVGATIDFLAGTVKRAPVWMRKTGLEWVYRTCQEPKRLAKRYWKDICVVLPGLFKQYKNYKEPSPNSINQPSTTSKIDVTSTHQVITLPSRMDALAARDESLWTQSSSKHVIIDAQSTEFIDSTGTGKIIRFARGAQELGGTCFLVGAQQSVLKSLEMMRLRSKFVEANSLQEALNQINS
ncbi:WecB/TagA/CpsF family glycosyltransferase [Rubritalea marina]|uniref:WecB/TagA/CpsF family glycosyltransferase n=1 Tax=Rubritalea marina TaxID=361055 RepID=UPI00146166DD|nr:WecB/TagA/CpsF family glycosyltransferase [Rubritalea marina]